MTVYKMTPSQAKRVSAMIDELRSQAEMFNMDIDWELGRLIPKRNSKVTYWEAHNEMCDYDPRDEDWDER